MAERTYLPRELRICGSGGLLFGIFVFCLPLLCQRSSRWYLVLDFWYLVWEIFDIWLLSASIVSEREQTQRLLNLQTFSRGCQETLKWKLEENIFQNPIENNWLPFRELYTWNHRESWKRELRRLLRGVVMWWNPPGKRRVQKTKCFCQ